MLWPTAQRTNFSYGDDNACWPPGQTPLYLYLVFSGIQEINEGMKNHPDPIPGNITVKQNDVNPAFWLGGPLDDWNADLEFKTPAPCELELWYDLDQYFFDNVVDVCVLNYTSERTILEPPPGGWGGTATFHEGSVPPSTDIVDVMDDINMEVSEKTLYSDNPHDDGDRVVGLFNRKLGYRVRIKYTPT